VHFFFTPPGYYPCGDHAPAAEDHEGCRASPAFSCLPCSVWMLPLAEVPPSKSKSRTLGIQNLQLRDCDTKSNILVLDPCVVAGKMSKVSVSRYLRLCIRKQREQCFLAIRFEMVPYASHLLSTINSSVLLAKDKKHQHVPRISLYCLHNKEDVSYTELDLVEVSKPEKRACWPLRWICAKC
jgi:hypothetical protein